MKKMLCLLLALLAGVIAVNIEPVALGDAMTERCPDMAVCGGLVWHVDDMAILCEDVEAGAVRATLPLSEYLQPDEALMRVSVTDWAEDSVMLALTLSSAANSGTIRLL